MDNIKILPVQKINRDWHLLERSFIEIQNLHPANLKLQVEIRNQYFHYLWVRILQTS